MSITSPTARLTALITALLSIALLAPGCVDDGSADFEIVPASRDGILSTIILIMDRPFEDPPPSIELFLQNQPVVDCPDSDEPDVTPCSLPIGSQQLTVSGVSPGNILLGVVLNGTRTQLRLVDLRPETTLLLFLKRQEDGNLELLAHRRVTERFDDFDDNGQWIVEEVGGDN